MINQNKWIGSLPLTIKKFDDNNNQLDHHRWVNTISKKSTHNSAKKYSLIAILFVCGLLFVSAIKNETRNLQRNINNLKASINVTKFNLQQAILDNEVITSPENISLLAKEHLNINLTSYKKSQIKQLNTDAEKFVDINNKSKKEKINKKKILDLSTNIKSQVAKKIERKKLEIKKLQNLYNDPKSIPDAIKSQVAIKIKEKKNELENIYNEPKDILTLKKAGRWGVVQIVKVFLGMPVIPGR